MGGLGKALIAEGEARGKAIGEARGKVEGIIGSYKDFNCDDNAIAEILMKKLSISYSEARNWIDWYYSECTSSADITQ